ncbi:MAG TPA: PorV/PorQ family protein [Bacteroidota bacterium]|nr:PorV/PorQ family protein [Bacteroidota bacterium]
MKKVLYGYLIVFICVATVLLPGNTRAQNQRVGTSAAPELLIPVGARDLALGGSSIASTQGVDAIYWNPGGLGRLGPSAEGLFSYMSYIADIGVSYGAVAGHFGSFGVVGLSVKSLSIGDIPLTTADDPEGESGRLFSPTYFTLGLSYGRQLTDNISAGGTTKIISESVDQVSATGIAFDLGIQYNNLASVPGLGLGVTIKNIGPQLKFDGPGLLHNAVSTDGSRPVQPYSSVAASFELPSLVEIGLAYVRKIEDNMVWSVNSSFTNNNLYLDEYHLGGEYGYVLKEVQLFGRGGYSFLANTEGDAQIFGITLGVGISYKAENTDITFDYAYRQADFFENNNVVSLKVGF